MEDQNEIKEATLTGYPKMISYECTKSIINQMRNDICKIKIGEEQTTGFFCKIPFPTMENQLPVFITNNHAINEKCLNTKDAKISIDIKSKNDLIKIKLDNRLKYTSEKYDVTIIELKENDNIKNYLELDDNIIKDILKNENENKEYIDNTIYIIQYPEGELSVSYGVLHNLCLDKKFEFNHKCSTRGGSSGSPILNIKNNKIIGIHKGSTNNYNKNINKGTFLNFPIKEFIERELNSNKNNKEKKLNIFYKIPPLIGLQNIGATSYMNATLQCFSQIEELVLYIKENPKIDNIIMKYKNNKELCLTESFKLIIDNLWPNYYKKELTLIKNINNYYFSPKDFKNKISSMNLLFKGVYIDIIKDLINFIIETLNYELNERKNKWENYFNIEQRHEQLVFQNFITNFDKSYKSIMSDIFYGITHCLTKCLNCSTITHYFECYHFLIFGLEEVRKYKLQEILNTNPSINLNIMNFNRRKKMNQKFQNDSDKITLLQNNKVDIYDYFDYYQKIENMIGDNEMYCNFCKKSSPATLESKLVTGPEVLIVILNRGRDNEYNIQLHFNLQLDLSNYIENKTSGCLYDLFGVIIQNEKSEEKRNYIAFCKSPIDNDWYQYNDDLVFPIINFDKEIINYNMPHVLFYKKKMI